MAGDIYGFADEEESGHFICLHGLGGQFFGIDASYGDFGLRVAFGSGWLDLPIVEAFGNGAKFLNTGLQQGPGVGLVSEPSVGKALGNVI